MKYKHTFLYSFVAGICMMLFVVLYIRLGNVACFQLDGTKTRNILIIGVLLSFIAGVISTISYQKYTEVLTIAPSEIMEFKILFSRRALVPSFFFPFGILIGNIIINFIIYGKFLSPSLLFQVLIICSVLYLFGIIGTVVGTIFIYTKNSVS